MTGINMGMYNPMMKISRMSTGGMYNAMMEMGGGMAMMHGGMKGVVNGMANGGWGVTMIHGEINGMPNGVSNGIVQIKA